MRSLLTALCLAVFVSATPLVSKRWDDDFQVKHAWNDVPSGWNLHQLAPLDHVIDMRISLTQDKFEELVTALYEVSDPSHERSVCCASFPY